MNILITGIGGPTPRSIAHRLRELYPGAVLIGIDSNSRAIGFYLEELLDNSYVVPQVSSNEYWKIVKQIVDMHSIDFAFIQPEYEVLAWGQYYKEHGVFICPALIPPVEYTRNLINKARMADLLCDTEFIPYTIRFRPQEDDLTKISDTIGYPCWIRASVGSGGYGSLRLKNQVELEGWLSIHDEIEEFTVSEYLPGRHLANEMLYINGELYKNAGLHCIEYVMAITVPSHVTGNTSFGKLLNDDHLLEYCADCIDYISDILHVKPHGVFSFDLKEDSEGNLKVSEINIRHMAYVGVMAEAGYDLIQDTVKYLFDGTLPKKKTHFHFRSSPVFLRDVDTSPVLIPESRLFNQREIQTVGDVPSLYHADIANMAR